MDSQSTQKQVKCTTSSTTMGAAIFKSCAVISVPFDRCVISVGIGLSVRAALKPAAVIAASAMRRDAPWVRLPPSSVSSVWVTGDVRRGNLAAKLLSYIRKVSIYTQARPSPRSDAPMCMTLYHRHWNTMQSHTQALTTMEQLQNHGYTQRRIYKCGGCSIQIRGTMYRKYQRRTYIYL